MLLSAPAGGRQTCCSPWAYIWGLEGGGVPGAHLDAPRQPTPQLLIQFQPPPQSQPHRPHWHCEPPLAQAHCLWGASAWGAADEILRWVASTRLLLVDEALKLWVSAWPLLEGARDVGLWAHLLGEPACGIRGLWASTRLLVGELQVMVLEV